MRLATGAGIREGGVGGNLRATEASSSCQVQASTQGQSFCLRFNSTLSIPMQTITVICGVKLFVTGTDIV